MTQAASAIRAYHDPSEKPRRKTQLDVIEEFLRDCGRARTLAEIGETLRSRGMKITDATVSARLNDGLAQKRLDIYGERRCEVNRKFIKQVWFIANPDPQKKLFGVTR